MTSTDKSEALSHSILSSELDDFERGLLADRMGVQMLEAGETLSIEGEARGTLFTLVSGRIEVRRKDRKGEEPVYEMREGECAGTRSFVDGSPRRATLRAKVPSRVLTLEPADFEGLIDTHPWIVYKVMRAIFRITHANLMRMNHETSQLQDYFLRTGNRH
jgi:CRP-like cAMP-binding protein